MLAMRRRRLRNRATFAAASVPATGGTSGFSGFGGGKPMFGANTFQQGNQQSSPYNNQYTGQPYGGQQGYQQGSYEQHNANGANGAGFAPPSSPPPSYGNGDTLYKPPSGPPPAHTKGNENGQFVGGFRP
ncbi:hypothetical protein VKT23_004515 [Stygiomarasmius scandens]|uniref:Uncharacterized protein n=1 Tax=Marasmiellus scandens TaxID=2682957 RepID=A0ABR1K0S2_9AGAR